MSFFFLAAAAGTGRDHLSKAGRLLDWVAWLGVGCDWWQGVEGGDDSDDSDDSSVGGKEGDDSDSS